MPTQPNHRNRNERLLEALRYFGADGDKPRPMEDAPKGTGWTTIHNLEDAGLIEQAGTGSSIRKTPFRITAAGRAVLAADSPEAWLPTVRGTLYQRDAASAPAERQRHEPECDRGPEIANLGRPAPSAVARRETMGRGYAPRGLSRVDAAWYIGVGITKFDEMVADRRMPHPKKVDGRNVWDRIQLDAAFTDLPSREGSGNRIDAATARARAVRIAGK